MKSDRALRSNRLLRPSRASNPPLSPHRHQHTIWEGKNGENFESGRQTGMIPAGSKKGTYCTEGLTTKDPQFANGQRIIFLAQEKGHESEFIAPLHEAIEAGQRHHAAALRIEASLTRHKALEDEQKELKSTLKGIEAKRDELVASARARISVDEARQVILARLRRELMEVYQAYVRTEQRHAIKAVENLRAKYAINGKVPVTPDPEEAGGES